MSSTITSYRDLVAWQKSVELGLEIYRLTSKFPDSERFGLVSQLRRAAVSVSSNIADGYGRGSTQDYARFLRSSRGSLYEVDTQMLYAVKLGYVEVEVHAGFMQRLSECGRVLSGLLRSVESSDR